MTSVAVVPSYQPRSRMPPRRFAQHPGASRWPEAWEEAISLVHVNDNAPKLYDWAAQDWLEAFAPAEARVKGPYGYAVEFQASDDVHWSSAATGRQHPLVSKLHGAGAFTMMVAFNWNLSGGGTWATAAGLLTSVTGDPADTAYLWRRSSNAQLRQELVLTTAGAVNADAPAVNDGVWALYVGRWESGGLLTLDSFLEGGKHQGQGTAGPYTDTIVSTAYGPLIGSPINRTQALGSLAFYGLWARRWSDTEVDRFAHGIFEWAYPRSIYAPFGTSAKGRIFLRPTRRSYLTAPRV